MAAAESGKDLKGSRRIESGACRMKSWRKVLIGVSVLIVLGVGYTGYGIVRTIRHIPEAYAAWDVGVLLIEYMKVNDRRWPNSWESLLSVTNGRLGQSIVFRGAKDGDGDYVSKLCTLVAIDWHYDVSHFERGHPVTRFDGKPFPVVWSGAEPNEMVRRFLRSSQSEDAVEP